MAPRVTIQCAQVFIHFFSNKSRSTTKLFVSEPTPAIQDRLGKVFGIIEINTPSRENSKIINQVIADIEHTYYSFAESDTTIESAFEETLKHVNTSFVSIVTGSTSTLVGNLNEHTMKEKINLVIGVIKDTSVIFTSLNTVGGFLLHKTNQDYKTISIIENQEDAVNNPALFNAVMTGEVKADDYLLFANNDFLNFISKERFSKTITSLPPHKAADYFKNSLLQHEGFNFAALIIKVTNAETPSTSGAKPQSLTSIDTLNAHESSTERLLSPSLIPNLHALTQRLRTLWQPSPTPQEDLGPPPSDEQQEVIEQPSPHHTKPLLAPLQRTLSQLKTSLNLNLRWNATRNLIKLRFNQFLNKIAKIPKTSKLLILAVLVFGSLFGYSVVFLRHSNFSFSQSETVNPALTSLSAQLDEAEAKLIAGDNQQAREILATVETTLGATPIDSSVDQAYAQQLTVTFDRLIAKLRNITLVADPTLITTITPQGASTPRFPTLARTDETVYMFDAANSAITAINTRTREQTPLNGSFNGTITNANVEEKRVLFTTDTNQLYEIVNNTILQIPISLRDSELIADFTFYNNFLYALIPSTDQIYRHAREGATYGSGVTWIQESGIQLDDAIAIGIDTRIWVATSSGTVLKFFKGARQAFNVQGLEPELTNITHMIKGETSNFVYVLDATHNRVVVLNDEGIVITQYFSPSLSNITAFTVDEAGKALYVANGNELYAIIMSHL